MRKDSRLSRMLHVLIHMGRHEERATSETIAQMLGTNPVVVRRTMGLLKEQGFVTSENALSIVMAIVFGIQTWACPGAVVRRV